MDDKLCCYGCGLIFDAGDAEWETSENDPGAVCPDCGSTDVVTFEQYRQDMG